MSRPRYGFYEISDRLALGIEVNNKPLLSLLDMKRSSGVHETEASRAVLNFTNAAEIYRPEAHCVSLHSDQFPQCDLGNRVHDPDPSQIELLPSLKGFAGGHEDLQSSADLAAGEIMHKTLWWSSMR